MSPDDEFDDFELDFNNHIEYEPEESDHCDLDDEGCLTCGS